MGDVHYLSTCETSRQRLLEKWVGAAIDAHPNSAVAERWRELAFATLHKYPGAPAPSQSSLDLELVDGLSTLERARLTQLVSEYIEHYMDDVNGLVQAMHGELLTLQRKVAEQEINNSKEVT